MWSLMNKIKEQTKQKQDSQTQRTRVSLMVDRGDRARGPEDRGGGIEKYKLIVPDQPRGCELQHGEQS